MPPLRVFGERCPRLLRQPLAKRGRCAESSFPISQGLTLTGDIKEESNAVG